ncbi:hypothetical protein AHAS_Ahas20G0275300 [Arachis hypogaea]
MLLRLPHESSSYKTYQLRRALMMVAVPLVLVTIVLYVLPSISSNESIEDYTLTHRKISLDNRASSFYAVFFDAAATFTFSTSIAITLAKISSYSFRIEFKALCSFEIDEIVRNLMKLLEKYLYAMAQSVDEQLLVVSQVLVSDINIGYEEIVNTQVLAFNGKPVKNLKSLATMVENCDDEFLKFDLEYQQVSLFSEKWPLDVSVHHRNYFDSKWPHIIVPTFKITAVECLQKIQIGKQISLVRMKLSWPLSTREAIVHYYLFEYYQDNLVVVLLNSVSDSKSITGFNSDANQRMYGLTKWLSQLQRDLWTQYICKACGDRVLRGLHEWEQHKKGHRHRKCISNLKSKAQSLGTLDKMFYYYECK